MPGLTAAAPESPYVQPTFDYALRIWWAFYWPLAVTTIFAFFFAVVIGVIFRSVLRSAMPEMVWGIVGVIMLFYFAFSFLVMYYLLDKKFRHFRVALVSSADYAHPKVIPRTGARVGRVWFAYIWRAVLYGVLASLVVSFPLNVITGPFVRMPALYFCLRLAAQIAISGAVGLYIIYNNILDERFGDARVCLLRRDVAPSGTQANAVAGPSVW
ncbi:MAG: hypothetical protein WA823_08720 [Candidatus Acidiferrales bacterium]